MIWYSGSQPMLDMDSLAKLRSFNELVSNSKSSSSSSIFFIRILYLKVIISNKSKYAQFATHRHFNHTHTQKEIRKQVNTNASLDGLLSWFLHRSSFFSIRRNSSFSGMATFFTIKRIFCTAAISTFNLLLVL